MKNFALRTLVLIGCTLSLSAQEGQTWGTLQLGEAIRRDTNVYQNGIAFGVGGGTWLTDRWGLDFKALRTVQPARYIGYPDTHEYLGLGALLLNVGPRDRAWVPYLALGAGGSRLHAPFAEASTKFNLNAGVGLLGHTWNGFTVQLDAKVVNVSTEYANHFRELLTLAGVGYTFGVRHPQPAPPPPPEPVQPAVVVLVTPAPAPPPPPPPPPAPVPVAVVEPPPPPPVKIILDEARLHFNNGKADLDEAGRQAVRKVARELAVYKGNYRLVVTGHTSHTGGAAFNLRLSKERAEAVAQILREQNIPDREIVVEGRSWNEPLDTNATPEGQARNRRVEVDVQVHGKSVTTDLVEEHTRDATTTPATKPRMKRKPKA